MLPASPPTARRVGASSAAVLPPRRRPILGPSFLAACGSDSGTSSSPSPTDDGGAASGTLRVSNWPLYMADGFVAEFQTASGITVDYKEDFNDNEQWFAKVKEPLSAQAGHRRRPRGADHRSWPHACTQLGWLNDISDAGWSNKKNLRQDLLNTGRPRTQVQRAVHVRPCRPAYNRAATGSDIKTIDDMWDPAFKGKVSLFSDTQDGLGMLMLSQGYSLEDPSTEAIQKAVDLVKEQKDKGQIRRFTGNDYADDLAAGNIAVAQAYSGDVMQLQADNPDLQFIIPESGATVHRHHGDPVHHAEPGRRPRSGSTTSTTAPTTPSWWPSSSTCRCLSDMTEELDKIDPATREEPADRSAEGRARTSLKSWAALNDEQTQELNTLYAAVTGG